MSGGTLEFKVAETDDTYMFAGFVVNSEELNKFGTQTVDGDEDDDNGALGYIALALFMLLLVAFFFIVFLKRRKRQEDEEDVDETIIDDY
jgi:LPXTG-motif cell wall-anchored protein